MHEGLSASGHVQARGREQFRVLNRMSEEWLCLVKTPVLPCAAAEAYLTKQRECLAAHSMVAQINVSCCKVSRSLC